MPRPVLVRLCRFFIYTGLIGSLVSLLAYLSEYHLVFDLISHFRIQYLVLITVVLCLSVVARTRVFSVVLLFCLFAHATTVVRSAYLPAQTPKDGGPPLRVMTSNLLASNHNHQATVDFIRHTDPDVIVFQEYTSAWDQALSNALPQYPYKITVPISNPFGIALYSKLALTNTVQTDLAGTGKPTIAATANIADTPFRIIGTHPPPPMSGTLYTERNLHLQKLAGMVKMSNEPVVVLGDLNITPWSAHFQNLINDGSLLDSRNGFGILSTWPDSVFVLQIPIDHILVSQGVHTMHLQTSNNLHSDHKTLWADIQFND